MSTEKPVKLRLCFKYGYETRVTVDSFEFKRDLDGTVTQWKLVGLDYQLGFNPQDLILWEVVR